MEFTVIIFTRFFVDHIFVTIPFSTIAIDYRVKDQSAPRVHVSTVPKALYVLQPPSAATTQPASTADCLFDPSFPLPESVPSERSNTIFGCRGGIAVEMDYNANKLIARAPCNSGLLAAYSLSRCDH